MDYTQFLENMSALLLDLEKLHNHEKNARGGGCYHSHTWGMVRICTYMWGECELPRPFRAGVVHTDDDAAVIEDVPEAGASLLSFGNGWSDQRVSYRVGYRNTYGYTTWFSDGWDYVHLDNPYYEYGEPCSDGDDPIEFTIDLSGFDDVRQSDSFDCFEIEYYIGFGSDDLEDRLAAADGVISDMQTVSNTAYLDEVSSTCELSWTYDGFIEKSAEYDAISNPNKVAYSISVNPDGRMLNGGNDITLTDVVTNADILFSTISVVDASNPQLNLNWTAYKEGGVLYVTVPDGVAVVVSYTARVVGSVGEFVTVSNVAEALGMSSSADDVWARVSYEAAGTGSNVGVRLVKYTGQWGDPWSCELLHDVVFALYMCDDDGAVVGDPIDYFVTDMDGSAEIVGSMYERGWVIEPNVAYAFVELGSYSNKRYHVTENPIRFTVTDDPSVTGDGVYWDGDTILVYNEPYYDLVFEKSFELSGLSDRTAPDDEPYDVSIGFDADGDVRTYAVSGLGDAEETLCDDFLLGYLDSLSVSETGVDDFQMSWGDTRCATTSTRYTCM